MRRRHVLQLTALSLLPVPIAGTALLDVGIQRLAHPLHRPYHVPLLADSLSDWAERERRNGNRDMLHAHIDGGVFFFEAGE